MYDDSLPGKGEAYFVLIYRRRSIPENEIPPATDIHLQKCLTFEVLIIREWIFVYTIIFRDRTPA